MDETAQPSTSELTVVTTPAPWQLSDLPFSCSEYFQVLQTRELGRTLLHTPVITSTQLPFVGNMTFCQALRPEMGVVWVAAQQTKGKGKFAVCNIIQDQWAFVCTTSSNLNMTTKNSNYEKCKVAECESGSAKPPSQITNLLFYQSHLFFLSTVPVTLHPSFLLSYTFQVGAGTLGSRLRAP